MSDQNELSVRLEARNFGFRKPRVYKIMIDKAETKMLIDCMGSYCAADLRLYFHI